LVHRSIVNPDECPGVSVEQRERDEATIRRELGTAHTAEITYIDEGWDSRVYMVEGGRAVFKFPRSRAVITQYRHEIAALRMFEGISTPVRTPRVRSLGPDLEYFGYAAIVGQPLSKVLAGLGPDQKRAAGAAIGRFLCHVHRADLEGAPRIAVDEEVAIYAGVYEEALPTLTATFSSEAMRVVEAFFVEQLPNELRRLGVDLKLCHADLGPWNLVWAADEEIGVIDFGDVSYYDASKDFSGFGDETMLRAALDAYGADDLFREKVAVRVKAFPVLDLPFYLGKGDDAGVHACLDFIQRVVVGGDDSGEMRFGRA
jgi:Ser/Thr protein kinase RdoA (MazF antagonist)